MQHCECGEPTWVEVKRGDKTLFPCYDCYFKLIKEENKRKTQTKKGEK